MSWIIYTLIAITILGFSDLFRKLASNLKDAFFTNLLFQIGAFTTAIALFFLFSRKVEQNPRNIAFALVGGILVSVFSMFSFKALSTGPGVSIVMPVLRTGGIFLTVLLGIFFLREKLTLQTLLGLAFSIIGIYLLFWSK